MSRKRGTGPSAPNDERVGYGRPPSRHGIRSGEVRNPWERAGKPKPHVDFLDETMALQINGQPRTLTRDAALDHFLFARAAKGDVRAIQLLEVRSRSRKQGAASAGEGELSPDEQAAFDRYLHRAAAKLTKGCAP